MQRCCNGNLTQSSLKASVHPRLGILVKWLRLLIKGLLNDESGSKKLATRKHLIIFLSIRNTQSYNKIRYLFAPWVRIHKSYCTFAPSTLPLSIHPDTQPIRSAVVVMPLVSVFSHPFKTSIVPWFSELMISPFSDIPAIPAK